MKRILLSLKLALLCIVGLQLMSCEKEHAPFVHQYKFSEKSNLTWEDFKGYPPMFDEFDAATCSGIGCKYDPRSENGMLTIDFHVYSYFVTLDSWVRKDAHTDALLAHEQLHYYVSELHTRILRNKIAHFNFTENYDAEIDSLYQNEFIELHMTQYKYDTESEHSINKENQKKWMLYVQEELKALESYNKEDFTLHTSVNMSQQELEFNKVVEQL